MWYLKRFHFFIQEQALFKPSDDILLAVSGGRDSVLLAYLFKRSKFNFGIAHCNFMLREQESQQDEQFVAELASLLEVPFFSTVLDTKSYANVQHLSIQMAARELRYEWLEKIRTNFNYSYIALAHHQNDTIETMLINLVRGTGIAGLHGILPKRDYFIRPMLCFNREEIDKLVVEMRINYREDSSNQSTKYVRNKIRLEVIPKLKELNPRLEESFEANRKRFVELEILLNDHVAVLRHSLFKEIASGEFQIELESLKKIYPLHTLLFSLLRPFGFNEAVLLDFVKSWDGNPGKLFESPTHCLVLDRGCVFLSKKSLNVAMEVKVSRSDQNVFWKEDKFDIKHLAVEFFKLEKNQKFAQLDLDLLQFPLKIRSWRQGDFFYPLGMLGNKKKLSDFFVEQKIPLHHKNEIPILINGNEDILYVMGYRIDERYKVRIETKKVFILKQD